MHARNRASSPREPDLPATRRRRQGLSRRQFVSLAPLVCDTFPCMSGPGDDTTAAAAPAGPVRSFAAALDWLVDVLQVLAAGAWTMACILAALAVLLAT